MTIEKPPGNFVFLMKNTNSMQADKKIMQKLDLSKVKYLLSKDYLMTESGDLNKAVKELKKWHLI
jgi:hypothetical protein